MGESHEEVHSDSPRQSYTNSNAQTNFRSKFTGRKGFRKKKGDSPYEFEAEIKTKKVNNQANFTNPDPWARLIGSSNTAAIYLEGQAVTGLLDTGAQLSLISRKFCLDNEFEIQPLEKLIGLDGVNGTNVDYEGYVELNFQVPGRDFNEDHLFLVVPPIPYHDQVPVIIGTYILDKFVKHLQGLEKETLDLMDTSIQRMFHTRVEAIRLRQAHGCEPPLGIVRTTKSVCIPAGESIGVHGVTKIRHGGFAVNCMSENSSAHPLPRGLDAVNAYCDLTPGSSRVYVAVHNNTSKSITLPARAVVSQLSLANIIPKLLYPAPDSEEEATKNSDIDIDSDMVVEEDDLTFQKLYANQVLVEDIGPDLQADGFATKDLNSEGVQPPPTCSVGKETHPNKDSSPDDGQWLLDCLDLTGLEDYSPEIQQAAKDMLKRNAGIFSKHDLDMGRTSLVKHNMILTDPVPFKEKYRRIPPQMYSEVKDHLKEMLDLGAIRPSNSPWASAIVLVRKKDGRLRFCIDLRKLNNKTLKDSYSLPRIEQVLDSLLGSEIFSTLDLKAGYWQVEMVEECKAYTAFTCGPLGFYECNTMPFGATNAPATFQRLMENVLGELNMSWCMVYLDDIIIFSTTPEQHLERLEAVFQKLAKAGLKLKPSKCSFFKKEIAYLGHVVSKEGVSTCSKKVEAVKNWPTPTTVSDVRSFLGFVGFYRRFIKDFSKTAEPIRQLMQGLESQSKRTAKKTPVMWGEDQAVAFQKLKDCLCSAPVLAYPDYTLPFVVHTDSSTSGLGAILYQVQDGHKRVVSYASRSVSKAESNYPAHKLEFLALKWAITDKFHDYLYGPNTFDVFTDNNPLTYVLTTAKLDACGQRWVARLANYSFNLHYKAGSANIDADALSRIPWPRVLKTDDSTDADSVPFLSSATVNAIICSTDYSYGLVETLTYDMGVIPTALMGKSSVQEMLPVQWRQKQLADKHLKVIIKLLESNQLNSRRIQRQDSREVKQLIRIKKHLKLSDGVLYRKVFSDNTAAKEVLWQLVMPTSLKDRALQGCHDHVGHQGRERTLCLLKERFYWPGMHGDCVAYVSSCKRCLRRKAHPQVAPLQPILVSQPLELVHMDYLCIEPSKGNIENVLVITDHFTRYAQAFPSKTQTAKATAKILWENFIVHYGFPAKFISDQGRNFESDLIKELCSLADVEKIHTTPYHPMGNGQCERFNSTLCNMLGTLDNDQKSDWKSHLGSLTHAYNCTQHVSTTYSPYYLMFGRHPRLPIDLEFGLQKPNCKDSCSKTRFVDKLKRRLQYAYKKAAECSNKQATKYKKSYDKKVKGLALTVNDLVLVKRMAWKGRHKIQDRWEPEEFVVVSQPHAGIPVYKVRPVGGTKERVLHRNLLLPLGIKYLPDIVDASEDEEDQDDQEGLCSSQPVEKCTSELNDGFVSPDSKVELPEDVATHATIQDNKLESELAFVTDFDSVNIPTVDGIQDDSPVDGSSCDAAPLLDGTLDPAYLVPKEDESVEISNDTQFTKLEVLAEIHSTDVPSAISDSNSLVTTGEFLDFVDEVAKESPDDSLTESKFSSVMEYHEGGLDPRHASVDDDTVGSDPSTPVENDAESANDISTSASVSDEEGDLSNSEHIQPLRRSERSRKKPDWFGNPVVHSLFARVKPGVQKALRTWSGRMTKVYDNIFD